MPGDCNLHAPRRATFRNIPMHVLDFLTELQNAEISPVTLLSDSTTDVFPIISKILGTLTENICGGVSFIVVGEWIGQLELFKRIVETLEL